MRHDTAIPVRLGWSSPFVRWQGGLATISSLDLAVQITRDALTDRDLPATEVSTVVHGWTVPQPNIFYGAPTLAHRIGAEHTSGPMVSQACATGAASVELASLRVAQGLDELTLVVTADRTSNGPTLSWPRPDAPGGAPATEHWVLDNFACDPWTGESMIATAEATATEGGFTREQCDEVTLLRYSQYERALADDRRIQRQYFQPIVVQQRKKSLVLEADEGIGAYSREGLAALKVVAAGGVTTPGSQTHPADGAAGLVVMGGARARALARDQGVVRIVSAGFARAEKARMPKAPPLAARRALDSAGLAVKDMKLVGTHNPFAVNDLWFSRAMDYPLERMNAYGCSLIYGHPQGPTGMRTIVELVHALRAQGGGLGLFTGCAAGDMGAAVVISVE